MRRKKKISNKNSPNHRIERDNPLQIKRRQISDNSITSTRTRTASF